MIGNIYMTNKNCVKSLFSIKKPILLKKILFSFLCSDWNDHGKSTYKSQAKTNRCLKQNNRTQYIAKVQDSEIQSPRKAINFYLSFADKIKIQHREVLIFDEIGLIGTLGGSLGLFIGFSFFGYITPCVETIIDRMANIFHI